MTTAATSVSSMAAGAKQLQPSSPPPSPSPSPSPPLSPERPTGITSLSNSQFTHTLSSSPPSRSSTRNLSLSSSHGNLRKVPSLLLRPSHSYRPRWNTLPPSASSWNFGSITSSFSGNASTLPLLIPRGPAPPVLLSVSVGGRWVNVASQKEDPVLHSMREALREAATSLMAGLEGIAKLGTLEFSSFVEASAAVETEQVEQTLDFSVAGEAEGLRPSPPFGGGSTEDMLMGSAVDVSDALFNVHHMPGHLDTAPVATTVSLNMSGYVDSSAEVEIPVELELDETSSSSSSSPSPTPIDEGVAAVAADLADVAAWTERIVETKRHASDEAEPLEDVKLDSAETEFEEVSEVLPEGDSPGLEAELKVEQISAPLSARIPRLKVRSRPDPRSTRRNTKTLLVPANNAPPPLSISIITTTDSSIASISISPSSPTPSRHLTERDLAEVIVACKVPRHLTAAIFRRIRHLADRERDELAEAMTDRVLRRPSASSLSERASTLNAMAVEAGSDLDDDEDEGRKRTVSDMTVTEKLPVVTWSDFERFVKRCWAGVLEDVDALAFEVIKDPSRDVIVPEDFDVMLADLLENHIAFEFLGGSPAFQARFSETVVARLFYLNPRSGRRSMTLREFRKVGLVKMLLEVELATNSLGSSVKP
ncbi:hypothetical protein BC829DRAFT_383290 [Chytridium lagenaria]|nr:hypothetical protein BC829DRAFT_383290 [Chytridium lagenaria]